MNCLECGSKLVRLGDEQVNGRYANESQICPICYEQCPECGDWYSAGNGCDKHPAAVMITAEEQYKAS